MINVFAFIGPSGVGKSTLQNILGYNRIITWTSREPRVGEVDGIDYHFGSKEEIITMYEKGLLLEYTEYNGNVYGTGLTSIKKIIGTSSCKSIVVDANGAEEIKRKFPDNVLIIGVIAPYKECKARLIERNDKNTNKRLFTYPDEVNSLMELSDIIINNSKDNWKKSAKVVEMLKVGIDNII